MGVNSSSIARKVAMALSGLFLVIFLAQHFTINITSVIYPEIFNQFSHFMGTNFVVQAVLQPILIFGVIFHFVMGFILEYRNRNARGVNYVSFKGNKNSSWVSRNMLISGGVVLAFLGLHFYDFWIHEMTVKYVEGDMSGLINPADPESGYRYYEETVAKFISPTRTIIYVASFVLLAMHLWHGFASSMQTMGWTKGFRGAFSKFTKAYAILIPAGFIFIALYHHLVSAPNLSHSEVSVAVQSLINSLI